jgi:hypothetical protein
MFLRVQQNYEISVKCEAKQALRPVTGEMAYETGCLQHVVYFFCEVFFLANGIARI